MRIEILFPEFCNLYGDLANMKYLGLCLPNAEFVETPLSETPLFVREKVDMIYMGPMTERVQEAALERLGQILLFRKLEFPLKEIKRIMTSPGFDRERALQRQIELLTLRKEQLESLIAFARGLKMIGGKQMDFSAFDTGRMEEYEQRARKAWEDTEAYREYEERGRGRTQEEKKGAGMGLLLIFQEFGSLKENCRPESGAAQAQVRRLQNYITEYFCHCTPGMLEALGSLYTQEEFRKNIDRAGGEGTAQFASDAIKVYSQRQED